MICNRLKIHLTFVVTIALLLSGCIAKGKIDVSIKDSTKNKQLGILNLNIASVKIENDQLIVDGSNLSGITQVKFVKDGVTQTLAIESSSASQLVANGITAVTFNVGQVFDMILSTASAAATVPVLFNLNNKTVTATMLANMGALSGQVLKFNGTDWGPASLIDAQLYKGTWSPATILPDVGTSSPGDYWIVSANGTNAGDGITYAIGDWIISDGYSWSKLALSKTSVTSFNGRKGLVTLQPGDYSNLKSGNKIPGSNLNDLSNVDITTVAPQTGDVLKFNGTNWVAGAGGGGGAGSVGSTEITDLSITGGDIAENTINPSKIYSSSNDAALYLRGDKTWANFAADVLNVPLSTYALDATTKPTVLVTDRIGPALGKIQKFLNDLNTDYMSKTALTQTVTGTFSFTSPTSFLYTQLPTGTNPNEAANVQYVQNYVTSAVSGIGGAYAPGTLTTASAATSGDTTLTVASTTGYPAAGTLLVGSEAIIYTGKTATTFTGLTRGAFGTTAATITGGATVNNYVLMGKSTDTVTPKMVVTGSGNVGIGTIDPRGTFHLNGTGGNGSNASLYFGDYGPGTNVLIKERGTTDTDQMDIFGKSGIFFKTNGVDSAMISSSGNVGIGLNNPAAKLDVLGDMILGSAPNNILIQPNSTTGGPSIFRFNNSDSSGQGRMLFEHNGATGQQGGWSYKQQIWAHHGLTLQGARGLNTEPAFAGGSSTLDTSVTVIGNNSSRALDVTNGNAYFSGNVGIGTSAPNTALEVAGNINFGKSVYNSTDLTVSTGAGDTSITVTSTEGYPTSGTIQIDNELMNYSGVTATTFTGLTRGVYGTTAASHSAASYRMVRSYLMIGLNNSGTPLRIGGDGTLAVPGSNVSAFWGPTALGRNNTVSGNTATAFGDSNTASGDRSTVMGAGSTASGAYSTSMGFYTAATGGQSTAIGSQNTASGNFSFATGSNTSAQSYASTTFGMWNVGGGTATSWVATDPLFEIGIGTSNAARANALTVLKNGNVGIGNTNPGRKLSVAGSITIDDGNGLFISGDGNTTHRLFNDGSNFDVFEYSAGFKFNHYSSGTQMSIDGVTGNVGIGLSPTYRLDVDGDINTSTCFRIGATTVSGVCTSDARLKENVLDFSLGLDELLGVRLRTYEFNGLGEMPKTGERAVGVIAQELEKTNPNLVKTRLVKMHPEDNDKTEIKVVDYSKFTYMLINAVKQLYHKWFKDSAVIHREIASLKESNELKDKKIRELEKRLERIEKSLKK